MCEAVINALAHYGEESAWHFELDIFAKNVSAQRQWQTSVPLPPFAEVDNLRESRSGISELAFVNDQARIGAAVFYGVEDLVERHDDVLKVSEIKSQRQICARHFAGDCDLSSAQPGTNYLVGIQLRRVERY